MGRPANLQIRVTSDSTQAQQDIAQAETKITGTLNNLKTAGPAAAAAAAAAIGAALVAGIGKALDQGKIKGRLAAQLGGTAEDAQRAGEIAGSLFSKAITEDFQSAADVISTTMRSGIAPPGATNKQLESIATKVSDLAGTFDQDTTQITRAVSNMLRTGIAKNAEQAFDVLTKGFQNGTNAADDLLETFSEYSTQFRDLGLSAEEALGIMTQGLKGGARDADIVADALKELNIRVKDMSAAEGLEALGLNAKELAVAFAQGGPAAAAGLDLITDRLRAVQDPAERTRLAVLLLGTQAEDLAAALYTIDPSTAVAGLGNLSGAADKVGVSLRDNASHAIDQFKNTAEQKLVNFIGGTLIPSLSSLNSWIKDNLTPSTLGLADANNTRLSPSMQGVADASSELSGTIQNQDGRWDELYATLRSDVLPVMRDVALGMANNLARGASIAVRFILDLVDGIRQLVSWLITAGRWLSEIAEKMSLVRSVQSFIGSIGSLGRTASAQSEASPAGFMMAAAAGPQALAAAPSQILMRETFVRPTSINITIDGQQLQGRIDRTINAALQYDGARYTAGGWA